ncbi:MAG: glycosyltransferase [Lachnospiraceae bacterium]
MIMKPKFLYFQPEVTITTLSGILWGLIELGYEAREGQILVPDSEYDDEILSKVKSVLDQGSSDEIVITQDFCAVVAQACHEKNRIYISWVYDSPQRALYMREALYDTNIIFVFDKTQFSRLKEAGLKNLFYEPLAGNITKAGTFAPSKNELAEYKSDISFVGNLYSDSIRESLFAGTDGTVLEEGNKLITSVTGKWDKDSGVFNKVSDEYIRFIYERMSHEGEEIYNISPRFLVETLVLAYEKSSRDRIEALRKLSEKMQVTLYTSKDIPGDLKDKLNCKGYVSYDEGMPKVFLASKININITMSGIETGIPQRVFDIMAYGGFCLTDWRPEIEEIFESGKEIVTAHSVDEMAEKADYYLKHDRERLDIAAAGYKRVKEQYSYPKAVSRIINKTKEVFGI